LAVFKNLGILGKTAPLFYYSNKLFCVAVSEIRKYKDPTQVT